MKPMLLGAVAYDKKVVDIWEGMRHYFRNEAGLPVEVTLFLSYEAQVDALVAGRIDIAWNTNLAYLQAEKRSGNQCRPLAMRDADVGWKTVMLAPRGGAIKSIADIRGKTVALGSRDSGHAAILPTHFLAKDGLKEGADYQTLRFDLDVGKHGDTGTSETDVYKAVLDGRADAGTVGSPFWDGVLAKKLVPGNSVEVVWSSPAYNHCMFNARPGLTEAETAPFVKALLDMDWNNPRHRPILEAEGLRKWIVPDLSGYDSLREAAGVQGLLAVR